MIPLPYGPFTTEPETSSNTPSLPSRRYAHLNDAGVSFSPVVLHQAFDQQNFHKPKLVITIVVIWCWPRILQAAATHQPHPSQRRLNFLEAVNNRKSLDRTKRPATCMRLVQLADHWNRRAALAGHSIGSIVRVVTLCTHAYLLSSNASLLCCPSQGTARAIGVLGPDGHADLCNGSHAIAM